MKRVASVVTFLLSFGVAAHEVDEHYTPPPGSNQILKAPLAGSSDLEVLIYDAVLPPGAAVPPHTHPVQEFVYVIEGHAVHVQEGQEDRTLSAGDSVTIPPETVHAPRAGEQGARAVIVRIHPRGEPERTLVED